MAVYNWKFYTPPDPRGYKHNDVMVLPDGSRWILSEGEGWSRFFMATDPLTGAVTGLAGPDGAETSIAPLVLQLAQIVETADISAKVAGTDLIVPNPYPEKANAPIHPSVLYFPNGWNKYKYWMAFTPYPGDDSEYENPCMAVSSEGVSWQLIGAQPLVASPAGAAYNADVHIFMAPDATRMYLAFRERGVASKNNIKVMHTTDGVTWSSPITVIQGVQGTEDFGSPSIWWNGTGWTCLIHNLDAAGWPIRRQVSIGANIYDGFGSPTTVTIAEPSGRKWWHSFGARLPSGQVVILLQDNANVAGASGVLYITESTDDGVTFTPALYLNVPSYGSGLYRSAYVAKISVTGEMLIDVFVSDFANKKIIKTLFSVGRQSSVRGCLSEVAALLARAANLPIYAKWADDFQRADSAVSVGTAASGGAYTVSSGTWGISSNRAYPVANGRLLAQSGAVNHCVSARFSDMTTAIQQWLICRATDGANLWRVGCSSPLASGLCTLTLQSIVAGGVGSVNKSIGLFSRGDTVTIDANGTNIAVYVNGIFVHRELAAVNLTGTQFGIQANIGANTFFDELVCTASM